MKIPKKIQTNTLNKNHFNTPNFLTNFFPKVYILSLFSLSIYTFFQLDKTL